MGAAESKRTTKEVTKSDEQRCKDFNMYDMAPGISVSECFMCKTNNITKDNVPTITDIIIYFLILFTILFMSYLLYYGNIIYK
jgi:hypothetical protein